MIAIEETCCQVLDPVVEEFGSVELAHGFCSRELAMAIRGGIAPLLDQHAGHERGPRGSLICKRLGFAVDFRVAGCSSLEVAQWVVSNTPFDRLYFFGSDRPIHVSVGPDNSRAIVLIREYGAERRRIPQRIKEHKFLSLNDG